MERQNIIYLKYICSFSIKINKEKGESGKKEREMKEKLSFSISVAFICTKFRFFIKIFVCFKKKNNYLE